jgi:hypothetical protein
VHNSCVFMFPLTVRQLILTISTINDPGRRSLFEQSIHFVKYRLAQKSDNWSVKCTVKQVRNCKIWSFHSGDYEECRLLGRGAVLILCEPTFRKNVGSHKINIAPHPRRRHSSGKKFLCYLLNLYKSFEMRYCMFNAQITTLSYRYTSWWAGLNQNIPVNKKQCSMLTEFWATLYSIFFK